jgi:hypothetical protein
MAYHFEFDTDNHILRCRFSERVVDEEMMAFYRMATLLCESFDPLAGITDFSAITTLDVTPHRIRELAAFPPALRPPERVRVILATSDYAYGLSRIFEIEGESSRPNLHVVRSAKEVWAILGIEEPIFKSISEAHER